MTAMKTEPAEPMIKSDFGAYGSPYCSPGPRYSPHQNLGSYSTYPYVSPSTVGVGQTNPVNEYWAWNQVNTTFISYNDPLINLTIEDLQYMPYWNYLSWVKFP